MVRYPVGNRAGSAAVTSGTDPTMARPPGGVAVRGRSPAPIEPIPATAENRGHAGGTSCYGRNITLTHSADRAATAA